MAGRVGTPPSGVITLLTDFGLNDAYVGIVKGVLLGINPSARLVDLSHAIPPQDVLRGALALEAAYRFFPRGTVHLAVIDPGVGGPRRPLAVAADGHFFVGPDNGLLGFLFEHRGAVAVAVALLNPRYHRTPICRTFHARDIFGPVAAHCSLGVPLSRFGPVVGDPVRLAWPRVHRVGDRVAGQVLLADRFGNLLTNVAAGDLPDAPEQCMVEIAGRRIEGLVGAYSELPVGELGALVDSSGRVEVFVRGGPARERLAAGPGARVSLWSRSSSARTARESKAAKGSRASRRSRGPRPLRPASPTGSPTP